MWYGLAISKEKNRTRDDPKKNKKRFPARKGDAACACNATGGTGETSGDNDQFFLIQEPEKGRLKELNGDVPLHAVCMTLGLLSQILWMLQD